VGGLAAFIIGSVILIDEPGLPGFEIPYTLIGGLAAASAAFLFFVVGVAVRNRRRPVVSGREYLIGAAAEALEDFETEGWARVQGETWRVRSSTPVKRGDRLKVKAIDGLLLTVEVKR
jgi:membrane-bound serine protease (ClpP class)